MIVLLPSVNPGCKHTSKAEKFLLSVSTLSGSHENYKNQTDSKLPESSETTCFVKEDMVRGHNC